MTNASNPSSTSAWPTWPLWPFGPLYRPAASTSFDFDQPINPGWTFGNLIVNDQNSSAPDTERDIVAADSYGRQLGRVIDALVELIEERPNWKQRPALKELVALHAKIEQIKLKSAGRRLDRIAADLAELRKNDKSEYQRVAQKLREVLGDKD